MDDITVILTEREWDHVQLALENCAAFTLEAGARSRRKGLCDAGIEDCAGRYDSVARKVYRQVREATT